MEDTKPTRGQSKASNRKGLKKSKNIQDSTLEELAGCSKSIPKRERIVKPQFEDDSGSKKRKRKIGDEGQQVSAGKQDEDPAEPNVIEFEKRLALHTLLEVFKRFPLTEVVCKVKVWAVETGASYPTRNIGCIPDIDLDSLMELIPTSNSNSDF